MRVVVFSAMTLEWSYLRAADTAIEWQFETTALNADTAVLARGADAVVAFVNDCIDEPCLRQLAAHRIRVIALRCAGFNNVDRAAAKRYGIRIARVPAYSPHAVAEHAIALLLTLNRRIHRAWNRVREGNFALDGLVGFDLNGKTVGVIGAGKIGAVFARIMQGFGCRVIASDPLIDATLQQSGVAFVSLNELLAQSDVVSLHCPLTEQTQHLLNAERLALMKPSAYLINTGRGALIDTAAVIACLKQQTLGGLAIDVYEEEAGLFFVDHSAHGLHDAQLARLMTFPNVLITGHQGFCTHEALTQIAQTTVNNLHCLLTSSPCANEITL